MMATESIYLFFCLGFVILGILIFLYLQRYFSESELKRCPSCHLWYKPYFKNQSFCSSICAADFDNRGGK